MTKPLALAAVSLLSALWRLLPSQLRNWCLTGMLVLESRGDPAAGLRRLFAMQDRLQWVINERAAAYGNGIHPKHRLMGYHEFFVERIPEGARVLDIGCGQGIVARSIAARVPNSLVVGVELNRERYRIACAENALPNLRFVMADARCSLPPGKWSVIVLSNILEHIEDRTGFLRDILRQATPERVLVRVPLFERDWQVPMREELGIGYFSDSEHFIEHRRHEFLSELAKAGLEITEMQTLWGEIWALCIPILSEART